VVPETENMILLVIVASLILGTIGIGGPILLLVVLIRAFRRAAQRATAKKAEVHLQEKVEAAPEVSKEVAWLRLHGRGQFYLSKHDQSFVSIDTSSESVELGSIFDTKQYAFSDVMACHLEKETASDRSGWKYCEMISLLIYVSDD
jgi:hypothetical protein